MSAPFDVNPVESRHQLERQLLEELERTHNLYAEAKGEDRESTRQAFMKALSRFNALILEGRIPE